MSKILNFEFIGFPSLSFSVISYLYEILDEPTFYISIGNLTGIKSPIGVSGSVKLFFLTAKRPSKGAKVSPFKFITTGLPFKIYSTTPKLCFSFLFLFYFLLKSKVSSELPGV